jgi:hypothetical protein
MGRPDAHLNIRGYWASRRLGHPDGHDGRPDSHLTDVEIARVPSLSYIAFFNLGAALSKASRRAANGMRMGLRMELSGFSTEVLDCITSERQ